MQEKMAIDLCQVVEQRTLRLGLRVRAAVQSCSCCSQLPCPVNRPDAGDELWRQFASARRIIDPFRRLEPGDTTADGWLKSVGHTHFLLIGYNYKTQSV